MGLAGFVVMADNWVVSPILPSISKDIGVDISDAALIITAYMLPLGLFQLIYGFLADRFGKRQVISLAMLFFTISTGLCALASGLTGLAVFRALTGIFAASVIPISLALIGDIFPIEERQAAIGTFMGISFVGQGMSMAIGGSIAYFLNWRGVFAIYAVIAVLSTVLLLTLGKSIPSAKNPDSRVLLPYVNVLKKASSLKVYLLILFEGIFLIGCFSFLGSFIKLEYGFNNFVIGIIMTAYGAMAIVGGRLSGRLSAKAGRKKTIVIGLSLALLAIVAFILFGGILPVLIVGIGLLGLGFMLAHSTFLTMATEFAAKSRGVAMSLVAFFFMGGGGLGTAIGSRIMAASSLTVLFSVYGIGLFAVILAVLALKKSFGGDTDKAKSPIYRQEELS